KSAQRTKEQITSRRCFAVFTSPIDEKMLYTLNEKGIRIAGSAGKIGSSFVYIMVLPQEKDAAIDLLLQQSSFWNITAVLPDDKIEKKDKY
ncbi:MAG TPA: hypothetical protein VHO70_12670, partial [Chitinispirillaceae bacterium]|nr:hypothetical protein [Chitinispirillaceae bacterium]